MAGHKFGASGNASFTWAMNVGVPAMVAEAFRDRRIVSFSTACVYPFVPVDGPGAPESMAAVPPPGDYAWSCVGRERAFEHGSRTWGTPGRMVRLSYAIDMRYGVLRERRRRGVPRPPARPRDGLRRRHLAGRRERAGAAAARALHDAGLAAQRDRTAHTSIRWLAGEFGRRFGRAPVLRGTEAPTAWLVDTTEAQRLFGAPRVPIDAMIDWVADWVARGGASLGKPTHFETRDGTY